MIERKDEMGVSGSLRTGKPSQRDANVHCILQNMIRIFKVVLNGCKTCLTILG